MVKKRINTDNQEEIVETGRERWKIENKGFNEQNVDFLFKIYKI